MRRSLVLLCFLTGSAPALAANSFSLENATIRFGDTVYRAKKLDFTDSALTQDEMQHLLDPADKTSASERLKKLSAAKITSPEVVAEQTTPQMTEAVTYRDVDLSGIAAGVLGRALASGASVTLKGQQTGDIAATTGALTAEAIDLPALAHMLAEGRSDPDEARRVTAKSFTIDAVDFQLAKGGKAHIGKVALADIGGRALAVPMTSLVDLAPKPDAANPPSPERTRAMTALFADIVTSQSIGEMDMSDIALESPPEAGGGSTKIGKIAITGVADGKIAAVAFDGFSAETKNNGTVGIAHAGIAGLDLRPLLKQAKLVADNPDAPRPVFTIRFDTIDLDRLAITTAQAGSDAPVNFAIAHLGLNARDWMEGGPTKLSYALDNLLMNFSPADPRTRPLQDLGYKSIDLSGQSAFAYDAAKTELSASKLSFAAPDVGGLTLSARFSNVGPDMFSGDAAKARDAVAAAQFRQASLVVNDSGLLGRMIATQAKAANTSADDVRRRWSAGVRTTVAAILANNANGAQVADAAANFIQKPKTLTINAIAPNGIGLIDVVLAGQWQALLGKLDLSAKAE